MVPQVATRLEKVLVDAPVVQVLVERHDTNIINQMQFASAIKVEHRAKRAGVSVEEEFVFAGIDVVTKLF